VFDIDRFLKTKHLDYTFVLYSTCQTMKDNLIGSLLYFYKNEKKMSLMGFVSNFYKSPNKFEKHSLFTSCVFYIDRSQNTKQVNDTFVLYSTCQTIKENLIGSVLYF